MLFTKANITAVLLLLTVYSGAALALPKIEDNLPQVKENPVPASSALKDDQVKTMVPQPRYLLPANFGVKIKKFSIGTLGVGSFFRAWRNCIQEGKGLATIESKQEQEYLESMLESISAGTRYWIGATNLGSSSKRKLTWITTDLPVERRANLI
uniref:C-type lectin domain-containing protein n=1 Tax=Anopheles epiroticus TaxID=199890 RepID=A0A182PNX6_9DIPT